MASLRSCTSSAPATRAIPVISTKARSLTSNRPFRPPSSIFRSAATASSTCPTWSRNIFSVTRPPRPRRLALPQPQPRPPARIVSRVVIVIASLTVEAGPKIATRVRRPAPLVPKTGIVIASGPNFRKKAGATARSPAASAKDWPMTISLRPDHPPAAHRLAPPLPNASTRAVVGPNRPCPPGRTR